MIVVIGATGRVGSRLVPLLLQREADVRVFTRDADRARALLGADVDVARGDLGDPASVRAALAGAERVFLLTGTADLEQERTVIAAARAARARRIVKISGTSADERSPMRFARRHRQAEREIERSGLEHTILRCHAYTQGVLERIGDGRIHTCAQDGLVPMIDVGDVAAVAAVSLTEDGHDGRTYRLTGPEALTYDEVAAQLSAVTGRDIAHVKVSPGDLIAAMTGAGVPESFAHDLAAQYGEFAAGRDGEVSGDVEAVTGRAPRSLDACARQYFTERAS